MEKLKPFLKGPKIIFVILGVIILVELVLAIKYLRQPGPLPPPVVTPISSGNVELLAKQKTYKVGENIEVLVKVSTGGYPTVGSDVILHYSPQSLKTNAASINLGNLYSEYPMKVVDEGAGTIRISGISADRRREGFSGVGILATIVLKAVAVGSTSVTVEFEPDNTADTNLIESKDSKDILSKVTNLDLIIE